MLRIMASIAIIAVASASMAFTTYAYFSDEKAVSGTPFVAGTLGLGLGDTNVFETGLGRTAFAPGETASGALTLSRTGSVPAVLDWKASVRQTDLLGGSTDLASYIVITQLAYGGDDHLSANDGGVALTDRNGNGWIDLQDLAAHGAVTGLVAPQAGGSAFQIAVLFHPSAGNAVQGDTVTLDLVFHLRQSAATPLQ